MKIERNHKISLVFKGRPFTKEIKVRVIILNGINGLGKPYEASKLLSSCDICKHTSFLNLNPCIMLYIYSNHRGELEGGGGYIENMKKNISFF